MAEKNLVPVTGALISFVQALQAARTMFIAETCMAEHLGLPAPEDYWTRCRSLFLGDYAKQRDAIGLHANEITFRALMALEVSEELRSTEFSELPKQFVFDPWLRQGRGGIARLQA